MQGASQLVCQDGAALMALPDLYRRGLLRGLLLFLLAAAMAGTGIGSLHFLEGEAGDITVETTPPGATIFLDGKHRGSTPVRLSGLKPGAHQLRAILPGYRGVLVQIEIRPGTRDNMRWMLEPALAAPLRRHIALEITPAIQPALSRGGSISISPC